MVHTFALILSRLGVELDHHATVENLDVTEESCDVGVEITNLSHL